MWKKQVIENLKLPLKIVLIISVVSLTVGYFMWNKGLNWYNVKWQLFFNFYYGFPLTFVNSWLLSVLDKLVPWDSAPKKRAWIGIIGTIVITMLALLLLNIIFMVGIQGQPLEYVVGPSMKGNYFIGLVITILVTLTLHVIGFYKVATEEKIVSEKLRKEKLVTELNALRAHIDPHFLFNSFNTLSGLMDENVDKAQDFLAGLSKIYRYILENRAAQKSTIQEELDFAKRYLTLQEFRFENSIQLNISVENSYLNCTLPSLSLQLLLENAIKHNAFDDEEPLFIDIFIKNGFLVVKNNKKRRSTLSESNGMGLQNIADRYQLLSKKEMKVENGEHYFIVRLPVLDC